MQETIPVIETERLVLRPFTEEDAPQVHRLLGSPAIARTTLNLPYPYPDGAAEAWIVTHAEQAEQGKGVNWAIARQEDGRLLGAIGLGIVARYARGSLGYWLAAPFWNQGYMTEAVRAVTDHALGTLALHRVEATCFPRNAASSRVMEKAGLQFEGVLRGYFKKGEVFEDVAMYARVASGTTD